jgi:hypothetical protein
MGTAARPRLPAVVAFALALAQPACSSTSEPASTPASARAEDQPMEAMLQKIRADAAQRSGAPQDTVKILSVESVTWSDGSLGCPQPGMLYTQALVRGYRVRVEAGGATFHYHADARGAFIQCPPERALDPAPGDPA